MKDSMCPVCGRYLRWGEACYHDETLKQRLVGTFYGLKAMGPAKTTQSISLRKIRIAYILKNRYNLDIYNTNPL